MDILAYVSIMLLVLLFLSGAPLAVGFSISSSIIAIFLMGMSVSDVTAIFFSSLNSYPMLACPIFILAGYYLLYSGGMEPLKDFMQALIGHIPGGMAVAMVIFAAFLGSISGSSAACLAILGTVMLPILVDSGYERPFGAGIAVTAGQLGLLIPPSLFLILFGSLNQVSIPDLFLGGIGPGILIAILMAIYCMIIAKYKKIPTVPPASWRERGITFVKALPIILMPLIILGGIYSGLFSPTQAATVATFYAIFVGAVIYKKLTWTLFLESLTKTARLSSMIYLLVFGGSLMGKMFAYIKLPQAICEAVISADLSPIAFLLLVELVLLIMGFFFSSIPMVIVVLPLFIPTVISLGIDPVFYGILAVIVALIGEVTPPNGPQLWFAVPICKVKMELIIKEAWPFLAIWVVGVLICTFIPDTVMFLVNVFR